MSDISRQEKSEALADDQPLVTAAQVKDYLLAHPNFFVHYPGILDSLRIPHEKKGSVSLVERQAEQLREKVRQLQHQISELMAVAKQNERIYRIYADLNLRLFRCKTLFDVRTTLEQVLLYQLELQAISLKLFGFEDDLPETNKRLLLEKRFNNNIYYLGRLSKEEQEMLFGKAHVESVAMMLIGERGEMGLLAVASREAHHFHPGMDTLLITQLQKFLTLVVPQLAEY
ncbi:DUF484 family protein [Aliiglaciecola sp. CAU 1673]|uniref:DUF484 family protein n=1 Tax=Aliiglaciecola sp. CAU 1673 TaxID=3032595 RepID=UPI0023DCCED7|nr:DUF484 family protein [Aliiglaciecola sp. CAU 1673]MDF2179668.1 DUF484 family protein [Aliiglaciecola sp. CAU 1673]